MRRARRARIARCIMLCRELVLIRLRVRRESGIVSRCPISAVHVPIAQEAETAASRLSSSTRVAPRSRSYDLDGAQSDRVTRR